MVLAVGLSLIGVRPASAWSPIVHYLTVREAQKLDPSIPPGLERYANLPDYHDPVNKVFWLRDWNFIENSQEFCWSHGLLSSNTSWQAVHLDYQPDRGEPGLVMMELVKNKIRPDRFSNSTIRVAVANTINGFRAHNAADNVVHFTFFAQDTVENWLIHHGFKEIYAEYFMLEQKAFSGARTNMFTASGAINQSAFDTTLMVKEDTVDGIPFLTAAPDQTKMTAKLMCLAQQVYRKNRQVWQPEYKALFEPASVSDIVAQLNKAHDDLNVKDGTPYWNRSNWASWTIPYTKLSLLPRGKDYSYPNVVEGVTNILKAVKSAPDCLSSEYSQLRGWYDWSQATQANGSAQYWDRDAIKARYAEAVSAAKAAIAPNNDLLP